MLLFFQHRQQLPAGDQRTQAHKYKGQEPITHQTELKKQRQHQQDQHGDAVFFIDRNFQLTFHEDPSRKR